MFSYYGSKSKVIDAYPVPEYLTIIEPFAGSARYSLKYFWHNILLFDCRPVVIDTWKFLQLCGETEFSKIVIPQPGQNLDDLMLPRSARLLLGWLAGRGATHPRKTLQKFSYIKRDLKSIERQLFKVRNWEIKLGDYRDAPDIKATWFIDPPYQFGGASYRTGKIDYDELANWIQTRRGQVIVCENTKATWMKFRPLKTLAGAQNRTTEAIWQNNVKQLELI